MKTGVTELIIMSIMYSVLALSAESDKVTVIVKLEPDSVAVGVILR